MTLTKQAKKSLKKRNGLQVGAEERPLKNRASEEASVVQKQQGIAPVKMSKDSRASSASRRQEPEKQQQNPLKSQASKTDKEQQQQHEDSTGSKDQTKLDRKPSLRRKFNALLRGSADLPAAINRGLQPIRRSMSFGKGLEQQQQQQHQHQHQQLQRRPTPPSSAGSLKPFRTRSVQWYNSLSSLAEHEAEEKPGCAFAASEEQIYCEGKPVSRTHSLVEKSPDAVPKRRANAGISAPYGRHSDHYDFSIDLSKPPCEASSLPVLTRDTIDAEDVEAGKSHRWMEQQVKNGWGNLRTSARNLSVLRGLGFSSGKRSGSQSVRSRSLTQLDALGSSMLDTGDHHHLGSSGGGASTQQQQSSQQQQHSPHHQTTHHHFNECSPRFLVPNAASTDGARPNRTRHKLSRSQVSSSEYFSVSFEIGDETCTIDREEFLPATKGTYLAEVLSGACERRGVDLSRVDVLLDSFAAPLPLHTTETSCLGGKHLRITAKDEKSSSRSASQRSSQNVSFRKTGGPSDSQSYRGRSSRFFSVSTEDSSMDSEVGAAAAAALASAKGVAGAAGLKASKQRWSGFFTNTKGTKMELLVEQLNGYTKHGVPRLPESQLPYELAANEEALFSLENDWRDIVENSELLSEKQQQQQTALWELAQTEAAYIKTLKVVTDLFMACLCGLQASNILSEVDRTRLFSNIPEIYAANREFWTEHIAAMLDAARSTRQPLDPGHLLQGFESFEKIFAPYTRYCSEQSKCQQYCRDRLNDNDLFTAYLVWCETQKDCNRLRLLDILVKPMQRITKYSLLLKAVHKNTEHEEQRAELTIMIKSVDTFVASVNAAMRRSEETARLASAASRLESYDVVESRDEELEKLIKLHSNLDIMTAPMPGCPKDALRTLLREGDLKLRDAATSKMEVHVLLLTDMLLICKQSTKKASSSSGSGSAGGGLKIVRQPLVVDRVRIHELKEQSSLGLVYLNEYGAASAALVLSAPEPKLAKSWMESIRKAQQQLTMLKLPPLGSSLTLGSVSRQASTYLGDGDFDMDELSEGIPRTPRGSSRASRVSSLAHSHSSLCLCSGSMEMEGASPSGSNFLPSYNPSRNVSVETTEPPRASSVSSEEGTESAAVAAAAAAAGHNHRQLQIRRSLLNKSPTPNTLSVQVPAYSCLGQSLPNLTLATSPQTSTVSPTPPSSLLIVPQITKSKDTLLSPGHRGEFSFKKKGISYPPPSPPRGALRRAFAIPQSRNPPLIKTRHVNASVVQTLQTTISLDSEAIEERRRRLEPSHRMASTSSIAEEKK
ncbi:pleckstrin homology domain-containing family G member 5 isoform X3 [Nasonia vitripennis]|uniref:Pleckstrin homology domain-containing family G member 5 n=1 Tax=Nasonia vitripennis TaxID=7425 RepID=A0A7M7PWR6_NASVI|nr:pleckstrin homology domain-containing family G member 5 isoform X3 [Nasonia vitripennis]